MGCLCLTFLTNHGLGEIPPEFAFPVSAGHSPFGRCTEYKILHYLRDNLPKNCLIAGGITPGIVISKTIPYGQWKWKTEMPLACCVFPSYLIASDIVELWD